MSSTNRLDDCVRRKERHPVDIDAIAHRSDGSKALVKVLDLSDDGCRMESSGEFRIGEKLQVAIPRMGQIKMQVRWCEPGVSGAKFLIESDF
jgi:hypothetical protein